MFVFDRILTQIFRSDAVFSEYLPANYVYLRAHLKEVAVQPTKLFQRLTLSKVSLLALAHKIQRVIMNQLTF